MIEKDVVQAIKEEIKDPDSTATTAKSTLTYKLYTATSRVLMISLAVVALSVAGNFVLSILSKTQISLGGFAAGVGAAVAAFAGREIVKGLKQ